MLAQCLVLASAILQPGALMVDLHPGTPMADKTAADTKAIRGGWRCVAVSDEGKEIPKEDIPKYGFAIEFNEKGIMQINFEKFRAFVDRFSFDAESDPKQINLHELDREKKEPEYLGIYELKGDELKLCINFKKKKGRPKEFKTESGGPRLYVLERIKDDK